MSADDSVLLAAARILLQKAAGNECDMCEDEEPLWRGDDQPMLYLHGNGDEVGECESSTMQAAVDAGLLPIIIYPRCAKGHDWYGEGCDTCEEEKSI